MTGRPTAAQEREPLSDVGRVFDVLCAACANVATAALSAGASAGQTKADAAAPRPNSIPPGSPAVTADEMLVEVFSPLAEEAGVDGTYLRASLVEYLRAADAAGVPVPPALPVLLVRHSAAGLRLLRCLTWQGPMPHRPQAELLVRDRCAHQLPMWSPLLLPPPAVRS